MLQKTYDVPDMDITRKIIYLDTMRLRNAKEYRDLICSQKGKTLRVWLGHGRALTICVSLIDSNYKW